jgi:arylsulfatase A-like enzyme
MDQNIGRLISALKKEEQFDNTIILFLSDNGSTDKRLNSTPKAEIGTRNSWAAYGKSWGNVSNTPYRKFKAMTHEGGIITPLIVHWPDGIKSKGKISRSPVHVTDIVPTVLSLAKTGYPETYKGKKLVPLTGTDIMPLVHGKTQSPNKTMFFEHQGNQAARMGNWKLVRRHNQQWELYNLQEDPTELNNLINKQTEKAEDLKKHFNKWAVQCGVKPWPVRKTNKGKARGK